MNLLISSSDISLLLKNSRPVMNEAKARLSIGDTRNDRNDINSFIKESSLIFIVIFDATGYEFAMSSFEIFRTSLLSLQSIAISPSGIRDDRSFNISKVFVEISSSTSAVSGSIASTFTYPPLLLSKLF